MNFFSSFFSKPSVDILIDEQINRRKLYLRDEDYNRVILPAFYDKEHVTGAVQVNLTSKSFDHNGIKIMLLGLIQSTTDKKNESQFITLTKELCPAGKLVNQSNKFPFAFNNVEKQYESYRGIEFNVRYILRVIISCSLRNLTWEREFYSTKDVITGRVTFKTVSMKLKLMLLQIIRRETIIGGEMDNAVLCKFEIMDGGPIKNEIVPIRFFLSPYELTPTYINVNNKFSVRYYVNMVLFDDKDKRYFKQHEIVLYRIPRIPPVFNY